MNLSRSFTEAEDKQNADSVFDVSYKENKQVFDTVKRRYESMSDSMREFMKDEIEEELKNAANKADENRVTSDIKSLMQMMQNLKLSVKEAMDALSIPASDQSRYAALL